MLTRSLAKKFRLIYAYSRNRRTLCFGAAVGSGTSPHVTYSKAACGVFRGCSSLADCVRRFSTVSIPAVAEEKHASPDLQDDRKRKLLLDQIISQYRATGNDEELTNELSFIDRNCDRSTRRNYRRDDNGYVLSILSRECGVDELMRIAAKMVEKCYITSESKDLMQAYVFGGIFPPKLAEVLKELSCRNDITLWEGRKGIKEQNPDEMEDAYRKAREKGAAGSSFKRQLLLKYCMLKDAKNAERIFAQLKNESGATGKMKPVEYLTMFRMYRDLRDFEKAMWYFQKCVLLGFMPRVEEYINFALNLLEEGRVNDAFLLLGSCRGREKPVYSFQKLHRLAKHLLVAATKQGGVPLAKRFANLLIQTGLCQPHSQFLDYFVEERVESGDVAGGVTEFLEIVARFGIFVDCGRILNAVVKSGDEDLLQQVVSAILKIENKWNTKLRVAVAYLEAGRIEEATHILKDKTLKPLQDAFERACRNFTRRNDANALLCLLNATKDNTAFSRDLQYRSLLLVYRNNNDCEGALKAWQSMSSEKCDWSEETLLSLAGLFLANGKPVPFSVDSTKLSRTAYARPFYAALISDDAAAICELAPAEKWLEESGRNRAIAILLEEKMPVETLTLMKKVVNFRTLRPVFFWSHVCRAFRELGATQALLQLARKFPPRVVVSSQVYKMIVMSHLDKHDNQAAIELLQSHADAHTLTADFVDCILRLSDMPECRRVAASLALCITGTTAVSREHVFFDLWRNFTLASEHELADHIYEAAPYAITNKLIGVGVCAKLCQLAKERNDVHPLEKVVSLLAEEPRCPTGVLKAYKDALTDLRNSKTLSLSND